MLFVKDFYRVLSPSRNIFCEILHRLQQTNNLTSGECKWAEIESL